MADFYVTSIDTSQEVMPHQTVDGYATSALDNGLSRCFVNNREKFCRFSIANYRTKENRDFPYKIKRQTVTALSGSAPEVH